MVMELVGLNRGVHEWLDGMATGGVVRPDLVTQARVRVVRRFYAALVLEELVQEVSHRTAVGFGRQCRR